jgi:hypothetical protein
MYLAMSGSTCVKVSSVYFVLSIETPSIRFPDVVHERKFHDEKKKLFEKQLALIKPALVSFFNDIMFNQDDEIKLTEYNNSLPIVYEESGTDSKEFSRKCRYKFGILTNMPVAGVMHIETAFVCLPATKTLGQMKRRIEKVIKNTLLSEKE